MTIGLQTPLRIKHLNRLQAALPFHVLVRAMLRRIYVLDHHFGDKAPDLDFKGLVQRAEKIEISQSSIRWFDWKRYSNRQEQTMLMGGMIGEVTYGGDLAEYLPLLMFSEKVHLGKATTFGLGRVKIAEEKGV